MTWERFMRRAQWDSTNKLRSPVAGMSSWKLAPIVIDTEGGAVECV